MAFGGWITTHDWFHDINPNPTVDGLASSFTSQLTAAVDRFFPLKITKNVLSDKPWITSTIKLRIKERQKAFHFGDVSLWLSMKSSAKKEIATRKKDYYENKAQHLRSQDTHKWWSAVSDMSGKPRKATYFSLQHDGKTLSQQELVNSMNYLYTAVNSDIPPLDVTALPAFLPSTEAIPSIHHIRFVKSSF